MVWRSLLIMTNAMAEEIFGRLDKLEKQVKILKKKLKKSKK